MLSCGFSLTYERCSKILPHIFDASRFPVKRLWHEGAFPPMKRGVFMDGMRGRRGTGQGSRRGRKKGGQGREGGEGRTGRRTDREKAARYLRG